jgi:hypothetical protein
VVGVTAVATGLMGLAKEKANRPGADRGWRTPALPGGADRQGAAAEQAHELGHGLDPAVAQELEGGRVAREETEGERLPPEPIIS